MGDCTRSPVVKDLVRNNGNFTSNEMSASKELSHKKAKQAGNFARDSHSNMVDFASPAHKTHCANEGAAGCDR